MMITMIINGYLLNLEIVLVLEMFADTGQEVIQCGLQLAVTLNRVWQIIRCMFMSGSSNREAAVLEDIIITGKG